MARILIVEDEFILALSLRADLEGMGHEVVGVAGEAGAALNILEENHPDLILMDIVLHGDVNGIELTAMINEKYGIPVIYSTAHTDRATLAEADRTRHFGIMYKPYQPETLEATIEKALA